MGQKNFKPKSTKKKSKKYKGIGLEAMDEYDKIEETETFRRAWKDVYDPRFDFDPWGDNP